MLLPVQDHDFSTTRITFHKVVRSDDFIQKKYFFDRRFDQSLFYLDDKLLEKPILDADLSAIINR